MGITLKLELIYVQMPGVGGFSAVAHACLVALLVSPTSRWICPHLWDQVALPLESLAPFTAT